MYFLESDRCDLILNFEFLQKKGTLLDYFSPRKSDVPAVDNDEVVESSVRQMSRISSPVTDRSEDSQQNNPTDSDADENADTDGSADSQDSLTDSDADVNGNLRGFVVSDEEDVMESSTLSSPALLRRRTRSARSETPTRSSASESVAPRRRRRRLSRVFRGSDASPSLTPTSSPVQQRRLCMHDEGSRPGVVNELIVLVLEQMTDSLRGIQEDARILRASMIEVPNAAEAVVHKNTAVEPESDVDTMKRSTRERRLPAKLRD